MPEVWQCGYAEVLQEHLMITRNDIEFSGPDKHYEQGWISSATVGISSSWEFTSIYGDGEPSQIESDAACDMMAAEIIDKIYGKVIRELACALLHIKNSNIPAAYEIIDDLIRRIRDVK